LNSEDHVLTDKMSLSVFNDVKDKKGLFMCSWHPVSHVAGVHPGHAGTGFQAVNFGGLGGMQILAILGPNHFGSTPLKGQLRKFFD
jgi:hypothetical protein